MSGFVDRVRAAAASNRLGRLIVALIDRFLPQGAVVLSVLGFGYLVMGQVRNRVFATTFGASTELDAYNAAFRIPEVALDILVASGLTAPFIPIFASLRRSDEHAANDFGRTVLTVAVLVMGTAMLALFLLAPWLTAEIGRDLDAAGRALYLDLFRINCLAQILFAASITLGEVLVAHRRFVFYALAPILYTGGIVVGTVVGADRMGIYASAWGAVVGAAAHLLIRAAGTLRTTFRIRPRLRVRTPAFREFIRLMLPRMVSYPIEPVMFTMFTILALRLGEGSASALSFASDYQVVPATLIGIPFSLAVFPALAAAYAAGDRRRFGSLLARNLLTIGALTVVAGLVLAIAAPVMIELLLGGGEFGAEDVAVTSLVLSAFALSVPFDSLSYPLSRALYATHNTVLQVVASFAGFGVVIVLSTTLLGPVGIAAIPLGYAGGMAVKVALLAVFVVPRIRGIGKERVG
jgi:putative peptidoglycan lipid II flippase